ncbi:MULTISPECIES: hypothetical protein [unclassified Streptomyces]|uniref:hypothetical protein n=1 Tax=unclassified Streptomyces TaxID=2593676 RepID=UPI002E78E7C0|nr:hypothetical protein [Streptomyces sp. JV190]MEE1843942.1 hypothetical protein [Streptomyces sp. JV190]
MRLARLEDRWCHWGGRVEGEQPRRRHLLRDKAVEMAQEDEHLGRLAAAGALDTGYRIGAGPWEGGRWIAVRWIDGVPLWRAFAPARSPEGDRPPTRPWLLGVARTWTDQTGHRRVPYADDTPRENKLGAIARGTTHPLDEIRPWPFLLFEQAIRACLAPSPRNRPSVTELTALLGET